ncbi:hypothetical protein GcM3_085028 [Golovinomyces cichoracearum]|uniref:Uncharacterized protein n=1 Tax=Golovinomyces cichoracearum TaxID=62708 RepID=A0A420IL74_9PEZI|nr:hypothetical protein GcM3_085028 [Golovinomyces cichoracearum]
MLKDDALDYYYDDIQPILTSTTSFDEVTSMIRDYFEGPEYRRAHRFRDKPFLHLKLFDACRGVAACENALYRPAETLQGLISDIRSSIMAHEDKMLITNTSAFFTDRRYQ